MPSAHILIVEDERIIAMALQDVLKYMGYSVAGVAASGEEAVQKAAETRPDVVLMDIRLRGEIDGLQAAVEIGSHLDIPVVYLTAYADKFMRKRAEATKPYGYIVKPFRQADIRAAVEEALHRHAAERKLTEAAAAPDDACES
jgi:CheY-like chemotaxis protein